MDLCASGACSPRVRYGFYTSTDRGDRAIAPMHEKLSAYERRSPQPIAALLLRAGSPHPVKNGGAPVHRDAATVRKLFLVDLHHPGRLVGLRARLGGIARIR